MAGKIVEAAGKRFYIGTSGWSYRDWSGSFYPEEIPQRDWLAFYATKFPVVEINTTFYRTPYASMVKGWAKKTPDDFQFVVKMTRHLSHRANPQEGEKVFGRWLENISLLGEKLALILVQLPPSRSFDLRFLQKLLQLLPSTHAYVIEFRHPSWERPETDDLLREKGICHCTISHPRYPLKWKPTASFHYIRFHGARKLYAYDYSEEELKKIAHEMLSLSDQVKEVYAFFNNDIEAHAPFNALQLVEILERA